MMTFVLPSLCISQVISFTPCSVFTIRSGKRLNRRPRDFQVDQNCAAVFLFTDKPDAEFLQGGGRIWRSAHPYVGRLPHLEESRGFRGAVWHASAQNYNIASAAASVSSRTSHRPAFRTAITTARVRTRQTDK